MEFITCYTKWFFLILQRPALTAHRTYTLYRVIIIYNQLELNKVFFFFNNKSCFIVKMSEFKQLLVYQTCLTAFMEMDEAYINVDQALSFWPTRPNNPTYYIQIPAGLNQSLWGTIEDQTDHICQLLTACGIHLITWDLNHFWLDSTRVLCNISANNHQTNKRSNTTYFVGKEPCWIFRKTLGKWVIFGCYINCPSANGSWK